MSDNNLYMSAEEAAAELQISRATLYAYVSRRGIRTKRDSGTRKSLYWRSDVLKAKQQRGPIATDKARPADYVETALTFVTDRGPYYRGLSALDAAERLTLEDVAAHLWGADRDTIFTERLAKRPAEFEALLRLVGSSGVTDRAAALLPLVEVVNPRAYDLTAQGMAQTGADVLRTMTAILLRNATFSDEPAHLRIARELRVGDMWADVIRRLVILSADNGLEAGTYVVRAAASVGITPYRAVMTGLLVSAGRRQKLGRIDGLARLLEEIVTCAQPGEAVLRRIREGDALPGFNSPVYPGGDPRATALLDRLAADLSGDAAFRALQAAIAVAEDALGYHPDFALLTMFVNHKIGLDQRDSCFFIGRSVGWIAHAIEQHEAERFHRPPLVYTGPLPTD